MERDTCQTDDQRTYVHDIHLRHKYTLSKTRATGYQAGPDRGMVGIETMIAFYAGQHIDQLAILPAAKSRPFESRDSKHGTRPGANILQLLLIDDGKVLLYGVR